ncbi:hypothetical protein CDAR_28481 [Caerostris darwini]|uniref:Uncharacterized protein n=1 Tax=Caerostris darwini TaxID=1538125 RepID=A0AAV4Q2S0_9ARAC|nr:hypothetical protein CDAR_28481 [Caerostris darwini]
MPLNKSAEILVLVCNSRLSLLPFETSSSPLLQVVIPTLKDQYQKSLFRDIASPSINIKEQKTKLICIPGHDSLRLEFLSTCQPPQKLYLPRNLIPSCSPLLFGICKSI